MGKDSKRFLWGLLGIVLLFLTVQNIEAVRTGLNIFIDLFLPLLYGCVMAFVLNLILRWLEKYLTFGPFRNRGFRRVVSICLSLLILAAVVAAVVAGLVPEVKASLALLGDRVPQLIDQVVDLCVNQLGLPADWFTELQNVDISGLAEKLLQSGMIQQVLASGGSMVGSVVTTVFDYLVGLCFSFYVLMQKEQLGQGLRRLAAAYLKPEHNRRLLRVTAAMNDIYTRFISGQCLDAVILGAMVTVTLAIFKIDYALLIGVLVAITALVPVVGAFIGGALGVFLLLMVSLKQALIFLIVFLVLQQVDNRLIYPHVVGSAVGLPAIWIFAAIVIGGNFGGIFGMILAIPLFALVYSLVEQDLAKREREGRNPGTEVGKNP